VKVFFVFHVVEEQAIYFQQLAPFAGNTRDGSLSNTYLNIARVNIRGGS
jgi:hypothetical protein